MGKTRRTPLTNEEIKEHHEFKRIVRLNNKLLLEQFWKDQLEELRHIGLRDHDKEQGESVHKK